MDLSAWVAYTFMAALVMAASLAHYRWREPAGTRRLLLGALRGAILAVVILLLFDPVVPTGVSAHRATVALVDGSLSMSLPTAAGTRRWDEALEVVRAVGPDRIQLFGTGAARTVAALEGVEPVAVGSALAPTLRGAVEGVAGRIVVVTDGALDDGEEVRRIAAGASVPIEVRVVGEGTAANLGLETVEAPRWVAAGEEVIVRSAVARVGDAGPGLPDSVRITLLRGGLEVARAGAPVPAAGRTSTTELRFRPDPAADGLVRLDVRVAPGGSVSDDDGRSVYVRVAGAASGVALVSFRPDQEPRFLLPVLEQALGLPVRGWIGLRGDRYLALGGGADAGTVTPVGTVRRAVEEAGLLVLHGLGADAPDWALEAMRDARRVLVLPSDPPPALPLEVGAMRGGEWYPVSELPSSPVAPLLAGLDATALPPLSGLRPVELPAGYWTPLVARLGRRGEPYPILAARGGAGDRAAIALGTGYWRWAFAGPEGREVYERLWSAVAGWLMDDVEGLDRDVIRPARRVVPRGAAVRWVVGVPADSVAIRVERGGDAGAAAAPAMDATATATDTVVGVEGGRAITGVLRPGHYRYQARVPGGAGVEGSFTVEAYSAELLHASRAVAGVTGGEGAGQEGVGGRPLHTTPWPYIVVVALLCAEWVLRRRWGLR